MGRNEFTSGVRLRIAIGYASLAAIAALGAGAFKGRVSPIWFVVTATACAGVFAWAVSRRQRD